jgi:hypothetical protein
MIDQQVRPTLSRGSCEAECRARWIDDDGVRAQGSASSFASMTNSART